MRSEAFQAFHRSACATLGLDSEVRGAKTAVAKALEATPQQYSDALSGHRGSLELLVRWAGRLGLEINIRPKGPIEFYARLNLSEEEEDD